MALCIVDLYDCIPIETIAQVEKAELALGDFTEGRHAWLTRNLRTLPRPFPCAGRQGLFETCVEGKL